MHWRAFLGPLIVVFCVHTNGSGQQRAMTIEEFRESNGSTALDSSYRSAMHVDSAKAVFWDRKQEFWEAWTGFMNALGRHLTKNGFYWQKDTRCTSRIYFAADGSVDRFLYSFRKDELTVEAAQRFNELLNAFVLENRITISAEEPFAQCGPLNFKANVPAPAAAP